MRCKKHIPALLFLLLTACPLAAQQPDGYVMQYIVQGRDTIFIDDIPPAVISPRASMTKRQWRKYYKRVHNFSKAYPYAKFIAKTINETDDLFEREHYSKRKQDRYLDKLKRDLLREFDPIFRKLTLSQGKMIIRLIDRETGLTPYVILKNYLDAPSAAFWQGFAKICGGDLKVPYDRFGEDKDLEELVGIWERGEFDALYFSIFGRPKPEIYIPKRFRKDEESPQSPKR